MPVKCKCGCGRLVNMGCKYVKGHQNRDEDARRKLSAKLTGLRRHRSAKRYIEEPKKPKAKEQSQMVFPFFDSARTTKPRSIGI